MDRDDKILFLSLAFFFLVVAFWHIVLGPLFLGAFYLFIAVALGWKPIVEALKK